MLPKSPPVFAALHLYAGLLFALPLALNAQEAEVVEIKAAAGLRFDPPRFQVAPGAKVEIRLQNSDDMAHNLVVTTPEGRMPVVNAAMVMPITPEQTFVPALPDVLASIPVLTPNKSGKLSFTAPQKEGVYPYVCTYPGHGFVMYGAMYVGKQKLPPLDKDLNVPELIRDLADPLKKPLHAYPADPPYFYRMFVRDSGPASIAVAAPGENNYVWDATQCRLRYAWRGKFLNPMPHWSGNGDGYAEVLGRIYWRSPEKFPLRFGSADTEPKSIKFRGYRLVDRYPEFRYEIDGVEVRELIKAPAQGIGLEQTFTLGAVTGPVFYLGPSGNGATFKSNVGTFKDGVLLLTAEQSKKFTVSLTEVPGQQPLAYWSMNDILTDKKPMPVEGVKGRAISFDGKKSQYATKINTDSLKGGATFVFWAKMDRAEAKDQVLLGSSDGGEAGNFTIGCNLNGKPGFGWQILNEVSPLGAVDSGWHQIAVVLQNSATIGYFDGKQVGVTKFGNSVGASNLLPPDGEIFLGSTGKANFAAASLDEVRIYDRVLADEEITALYTADRPAIPAP